MERTGGGGVLRAVLLCGALALPWADAAFAGATVRASGSGGAGAGSTGSSRAESATTGRDSAGEWASETRKAVAARSDARDAGGDRSRRGPTGGDPADGERDAGEQAGGERKAGGQNTDAQKPEDPKSSDQKPEDPNTPDPNTPDPNTQDPNTQDPNTPDQKAGDAKSSDEKAADEQTGEPEAGERATSAAETGDGPTSAEAVTPEAALVERDSDEAASVENETDELGAGQPPSGEATGPRPRELYTRLEGRSGPDFEKLARELLSSHPTAAMDALLLRAGLRVPAGLTAAVTARRESMREEALRLIRADIAGAAQGVPDWCARIATLFDGRELDPDLRCALFALVAELRLYEHTGALSEALPAGRSVRARHAARLALFELYRKWFETPEEMTAYREAIGGGAPPAAVVSELRRAQEQASERLLRLIAADPALASEGLADPSPAVRTRAARSLLESVGATRIASERALAMLLDGFSAEADPIAFRARLDALLELCAPGGLGSEAVGRLRSILCSLEVERDLAWSVLHGLSRVPWDERPDAPAEASIARGVDRTARLFATLVDRERVLDADLLRQGLAKLAAISRRTRPELAAPAREAVFYLLRQYQGASDVRRAAAESAAVVLSPTDVDALVDLLAELDGEALVRGALLRTLGRLSRPLDPQSEPARRVLGALVRHLDSAELDLRRTALDVLRGEELRELVARAGDPLLVDALARRLREEVDPDLWPDDLELLARFPRPDLVETVLATERFRRLVTGNELERVTEILGRLAGRDGRRVFECSRALVEIDHDATRVARLERAIALVAGLPEESARGLASDEHAAIVEWVLALRRASGSRAGGPPGMRAFLPRLVDLHLAAVNQLGDAQGALEHARAIFGADRWLLQDKGSAGPVLALFETALAAVPEGQPYVAVLRDRARFREAAGLLQEALVDFEDLIENYSSRDPGDLRSAARLLVDPKANPTGAQSRKAHVEAYLYLSELIERSAWMREKPGDRLQDLRDLCARALATGDKQHRGTVAALLDDLPPIPETGTYENGAGATESGAKWSGLLSRRSWHEALTELRGQVRIDVEAEAEPGAPGSGAAGSGGSPAGSGRRSLRG